MASHGCSVVLVVARHRLANVVLILAIAVLADVDAGHEFDPIEIREPRDTAGVLRLWRIILVGQTARRVQDTAHKAAAHVGPVRAGCAVEPDHRPDLALGVGTFENRVLDIEIDGASGSALGVSACPSLRGIIETAGAQRHAHLCDGAFGDEVGVLLGVVEIVPCVRHGMLLDQGLALG